MLNTAARIQGKFATDARDRLTAAVEGHTDAFVRSRAISAITRLDDCAEMLR